MLDFQNRVLNIKILKIHVNRDNNTYIEKCNFQWKLICRFWDHYWICGIETSSEMVLDFDFESQLVMQAKWDKLKLTFFIVCVKKCDFFCKWLQTLANYIPLKSIFHHEYKFKLITSQLITNWSRSMMNISDCTVRGHRKKCTLASDLGMGL